MTEPEDLEEDLFADLYDGDETTAPAPVTAPTSALVSPQSGLPATDHNTQADAFTSAEEPDTPYKPLPFESEAGNQLQSFNGQHGTQMNNHEQSHVVEDVNMDNEPFGSGIKEDG